MTSFTFTLHYETIWFDGFETNNAQVVKSFGGGYSPDDVAREAMSLATVGFRIPGRQIYIPGHRVTHVTWEKVKEKR